MPTPTALSCRVRISSRPVRSPTWFRRRYLCPPKGRSAIRPSGVRSKTAPYCSSSRTRSGASLAKISAVRGLLRNAPPFMVSTKCTFQLSGSFGAVGVAHVGERGGHAPLGHHGMRLAEQRFAHHADRAARFTRADHGPQARAARADHQHVVLKRIVNFHKFLSFRPGHSGTQFSSTLILLRTGEQVYHSTSARVREVIYSNSSYKCL